MRCQWGHRSKERHDAEPGRVYCADHLGLIALVIEGLEAEITRVRGNIDYWKSEMERGGDDRP